MPMKTFLSSVVIFRAGWLFMLSCRMRNRIFHRLDTISKSLTVPCAPYSCYNQECLLTLASVGEKGNLFPIETH